MSSVQRVQPHPATLKPAAFTVAMVLPDTAKLMPWSELTANLVDPEDAVCSNASADAATESNALAVVASVDIWVRDPSEIPLELSSINFL